MLYLGCHLSSSKGFYAMGQTALSIGANTFQFFTRNPRGSRAKAHDPVDAAKLVALMEEHRFAPLVAHAPYTINPCSAEEKTREFALMSMADDLARLQDLPGTYYNFHPGSHVKQGVDVGIDYIVEALNAVMFADQKTVVLLETMAGKGSEVGRNFEELAEILSRVKHPEKMGVCMDSCHVADGGYDIVTDLDGVLAEFDRIIGLDKLKAMHLNDSKNPLGSHKDRHETIGNGFLGLGTFAQIVNHPYLKTLPMELETPNELPGYQAEIALLRSLEREENCDG
ncbi:MAG: deoxyribonuclease IV [Eubacteriales bacterium]